MSAGASRFLLLRNSPSLRLAGLRGRFVLAQLLGGRLLLNGDLCGALDVPLDAITRLRAGGRPGVRAFHNCTIWRTAGRPLTLRRARGSQDYAELVLALAAALAERGELDRVSRGLPVWHALLLLCICAAPLPFLALHLWLWLNWRDALDWRWLLFLAAASLFWAALFVYALVVWVRRYWPRKVRNLEDLARALRDEARP